MQQKKRKINKLALVINYLSSGLHEFESLEVSEVSSLVLQSQNSGLSGGSPFLLDLGVLESLLEGSKSSSSGNLDSEVGKLQPLEWKCLSGNSSNIRTSINQSLKRLIIQLIIVI